MEIGLLITIKNTKMSRDQKGTSTVVHFLRNQRVYIYTVSARIASHFGQKIQFLLVMVKLM